ncbi:MAG: serine hydrolase [Chloroflexi bacterium]|nr:serine hydrolase [Chloroflexota bacterium]
MVAEAGKYLQGPPFIDIAVREALGFSQKRRDVAVRYTLNSDKLRAWLVNAAAEHNREPIGAHALPPLEQLDNISATLAITPTNQVNIAQQAWRWEPGIPGYRLDVEKSIPQVIAALTRNEQRVAPLALIEIPPAQPNMLDLTQVLSHTLATFPGFAAIYVQDLQNGAEANVDADVAFSGMSAIKLALVTARLEQSNITNTVSSQEIDLTLYEADNQRANQLLNQLGNGDLTVGAREFTDFMHRLGLVNTYMQAGFDTPPLPPLATPANQRTDWNTKPDPNQQTTPADMGRILAALYACTQGKGLLSRLNPTQFTPDRCRQVLFFMSHDQSQDLIWAGLPQPQQTWIVHKATRAAETHGDVALIWGPTGPYVLSIFLYQANWLDLKLSSETMQAVSRLTWDFFALQKTQGNQSTSMPPKLEPPPGYVAIEPYSPTTANPAGQ